MSNRCRAGPKSGVQCIPLSLLQFGRALLQQAQAVQSCRYALRQSPENNLASIKLGSSRNLFSAVTIAAAPIELATTPSSASSVVENRVCERGADADCGRSRSVEALGDFAALTPTKRRRRWSPLRAAYGCACSRPHRHAPRLQRAGADGAGERLKRRRRHRPSHHRAIAEARAANAASAGDAPTSLSTTLRMIAEEHTLMLRTWLPISFQRAVAEAQRAT